MAPPTLDDVIAERCETVLSAIVAALQPSKRPKRVVNVVPGSEVVWDDCCAGQLTARVSQMQPHRTQTPRPASMTPCSIDYWTVSIEVTLLRCAATVNNAGDAPSPAQLNRDGQTGLTDLRTILETLTSQEFIDNVTTWTPLGPNGGCFGTQ